MPASEHLSMAEREREIEEKRREEKRKRRTCSKWRSKSGVGRGLDDDNG